MPILPSPFNIHLMCLKRDRKWFFIKKIIILNSMWRPCVNFLTSTAYTLRRTVNGKFNTLSRFLKIKCDKSLNP